MKTRKGVFAVVKAPTAAKMASAEGKFELMERTRRLTNDGEEILTAVMRVMRSSDNDKCVLDAARLLLEYGYGRPIETRIQADVPVSGGASSAAFATLTAQQLEQAATTPLAKDEESEDTQVSNDPQSEEPS